jgi:hypothetical protein
MGDAAVLPGVVQGTSGALLLSFVAAVRAQGLHLQQMSPAFFPLASQRTNAQQRHA